MTNLSKILELYSIDPLPTFDNKILNYDSLKYNWQEKFLGLAQELCPTLENLEHIHLYFSLDQLIDLRKQFERYTNSQEFCSTIDEFISEYIDPLIPHSDYMIQRTAGIRVVIPNQQKVGRLLTFHTGYWTGYNNSMYTIWTPVTRTFDSNSMQVLNWDYSKKLIEKIHSEELPSESTQKLCEELCYPVNINYGQSWLFNQGHLHGNINNNTEITRVSFDTRVALKGEDFGPRRAGSFFRFKGESSESNLSNLNPAGRWVSYVDQNSAYIKPTPHYMIREFMIQYVKTLGIKPVDWKNEYFLCEWMPNFEDLVTQGNVDGIILPSVYAFTVSESTRIDFFKQAIQHKVQLLFIDENLLVVNESDLDKVRRLYDFIHD